MKLRGASRISSVFRWRFAMLLVVVTTIDLIEGSPQKSLTTTESPTHSFKGNQDRKNESVPCSRNQQCCKLGRKAARKSHICEFEALSKILEYQASSSHRMHTMTAVAHRMYATGLSYLNHARILRRRLHRCRDPLNKKYFQYCCKTVNKKLLRRDKPKRVSIDGSKGRINTTDSTPQPPSKAKKPTELR